MYESCTTLLLYIVMLCHMICYDIILSYAFDIIQLETHFKCQNWMKVVVISDSEFNYLFHYLKKKKKYADTFFYSLLYKNGNQYSWHTIFEKKTVFFFSISLLSIDYDYLNFKFKFGNNESAILSFLFLLPCCFILKCIRGVCFYFVSTRTRYFWNKEKKAVKPCVSHWYTECAPQISRN